MTLSAEQLARFEELFPLAKKNRNEEDGGYFFHYKDIFEGYTACLRDSEGVGDEQALIGSDAVEEFRMAGLDLANAEDAYENDCATYPEMKKARSHVINVMNRHGTKILALCLRYLYFKEHYEWRRDDDERDAHTFIGLRFPHGLNFSASAQLDDAIDAALRLAENKPITGGA